MWLRTSWECTVGAIVVIEEALFIFKVKFFRPCLNHPLSKNLHPFCSPFLEAWFQSLIFSSWSFLQALQSCQLFFWTWFLWVGYRQIQRIRILTRLLFRCASNYQSLTFRHWDPQKCRDHWLVETHIQSFIDWTRTCVFFCGCYLDKRTKFVMGRHRGLSDRWWRQSCEVSFRKL